MTVDLANRLDRREEVAFVGIGVATDPAVLGFDRIIKCRQHPIGNILRYLCHGRSIALRGRFECFWRVGCCGIPEQARSPRPYPAFNCTPEAANWPDAASKAEYP